MSIHMVQRTNKAPYTLALQYFHWYECKIYKYIKPAALTIVIQSLQLATCIDN